MVHESDLGVALRHWRGMRRMSQLDLASSAHTTPRYVSFVETGRSRPSREMVLRLAAALDVPLRERNGLLLAAGFAPMYSVDDLDDPHLERIERALRSMLDGHDPLPAVVMDRGWNVMRANEGAQRLFELLLAGAPLPDAPNVLRLIVQPGPVRQAVENWREVVPVLLDRVRREAVNGVLDRATLELVDELLGAADVVEAVDRAPLAPTGSPVIDVQFRLGETIVAFFSVVSSIGNPSGITAQEVRVEAFFPSDPESAVRWDELVRQHR
jgi:transcriptional regulator with XRE-family HTH domain